MKTKPETLVEVRRLMKRTAKEGGSLEDVLNAIEADKQLLASIMWQADPAFDALKAMRAGRRTKGSNAAGH
jgi:hypothetical protein